MSSLFFNGIDLRFLVLTFILILGVVINTSISVYRQGIQIGNPLIPIVILLFWSWLGISIVFSPVMYLSTINFWWVGILPFTFLIYAFSNNKEGLFKHIFNLVTSLILLLCIYALYQLLVLHEPPQASFFNKNSLAALINLQLFPLLAVTLLANSKKQLILFLSIVFTFTLLLGLINSRGALLAFAIGLVVMLTFVASFQMKRRLLLVGVIVISALISAQLSMHESTLTPEYGIVESIATLQDTDSAGRSRFVIWEPAWKLFKQNAWTGIGLGTYFLTIPPYLHPDDHSAGYYVHNDYLQIALETGIAGFILLIAILLAVIYRFSTSVIIVPKDDPARLVIVALFSGMLSIAIHSFFTFNLYIMPTMLVLGLILGHFNYLADRLQGVAFKQWQPAGLLRPALYYLCVAAIILTLLSNFTSIGIAYHYQQNGNRFAANVQLEDAHHAFRLSQIFAPQTDSAYFADADLLRKSALVVADNHPRFASELLQEAMELLDQAEAHNPLRPHTPYIRGLILEQAFSNNKTEIIDAYQTALSRNPRFLPARIALARYMIKLNKLDMADQVMQAGLHYSYRKVTRAYLELIELNLSSAIRRGNTVQAQNFSALLTKYQQVYATMKSNNRFNKITNPY